MHNVYNIRNERFTAGITLYDVGGLCISFKIYLFFYCKQNDRLQDTIERGCFITIIIIDNIKYSGKKRKKKLVYKKMDGFDMGNRLRNIAGT